MVVASFMASNGVPPMLDMSTMNAVTCSDALGEHLVPDEEFSRDA